MAYQIGQLRFSGSGCVNVITPTLSYKSVDTSQTGEESATSFRDILITPSTGTFDELTDYYLHIAIPQDINYSMTFNIKLVKAQDTLSQSYQFLKQVIVMRGGNGSYVHPVALYEKSDGEVAAMIPHMRDDSIVTVKDELYYVQDPDTGLNQYYLGTGTRGGYTQTAHVNMVSLVESWRQETMNYGTFDLVFRPVEAGFTGILIEMVRSTEDFSIQQLKTDDDGTTSVQYGRFVDIDKIQNRVLLYSLNNFVDQIHKDGTLTRIGVWSHPGLMMAVNGEEIRIGPAGFWEEDVLPVSSIGIVAADGDFTNNWTLDYTYDADEVIEEE